MRFGLITALLTILGLSLWLGYSFAPVSLAPTPLPAELKRIEHLKPDDAPLLLASLEPTKLVLTPPVIGVEPAAEAPDLPEPIRQAAATPKSEPMVVAASVESRGLPLDDVVPGVLTQLEWRAGETLHGAAIPTPVLVARGPRPGPTMCVTAAVHGDELNGIEAVRELMYSLNLDKLSGTVIGVPIVNLQGFQRHSRYLSDRRDLNRFFPGNPRGSVAARMAYGFFNDIVLNCEALVDLHTGSFHRTNLPQLRADLHNEEVLALTRGFGSTTILHSTGGSGTLRRAAVDAGIPAVTLEAGEPLRLQRDAIDHTVKALFTLLDTMQMYDKRSLWGNPEPTYYESAWVRADQGGMLFSEVKLGRRVTVGDVLGTVTDPITNERMNIIAPFAGRVIGMAVNQFVMPGYAAFHLAAEADLDEGGLPIEEPGLDHIEPMDVAQAEANVADEYD